MAISAAMPKELLPCETCGHRPNEAKRYAWLAGCPDDHEVVEYFEIAWLVHRYAHVWSDNTYSAIEIDYSGGVAEPLILEWLDACHAGKTIRHQRDYGVQITFERPVVDHRTDPVTGDTTVTYRLPSPPEVT